MGCPIHVWAPAMAAAIPLARYARDRFLGVAPRPDRKPVRELKRWAPVQPDRSADTAQK
jgi:hypothetical protein